MVIPHKNKLNIYSYLPKSSGWLAYKSSDASLGAPGGVPLQAAAFKWVAKRGQGEWQEHN